MLLDEMSGLTCTIDWGSVAGRLGLPFVLPVRSLNMLETVRGKCDAVHTSTIFQDRERQLGANL